MTRASRTGISAVLTHPRRGRTAILAAAALGVAAFGLTAHPAARQGKEGRVSQTVTTDFVAVRKDGQPVTDLKTEEVTLKIDGKIRPIKSLQYIPLSTGMGAAAAVLGPGAAAAVEPPFATNLVPAATTPRSIVIIVDDESMPIGQEIRLRAALNSFVQNLPPADPVALVTVPHGGVKVGFTTDRDRLARGIAGISPIQPIASLPCQTKDTLGTLEATLSLLTRNSDQPVAVAFLSASLSGQSQQEAAQKATISGAGGVSDQAGGCYLTADSFVRLGQAVAAARAQFYVIHPDYSASPVPDGIESLRSQTGAPLFHLTSSGEPGLTRMARETAGYYQVVFDTQPDELTGRPHPSSIKVSRADVDVRDKPFVILGRAVAPLPTTATTTAATVTTAFDMVRSGRGFRDLPLRATTSSSRSANGTAIDVIGWFEPLDASVTVMSAAAALIDDNGNAQAYWESDARQPITSWPMAIGLTVRPGTYRLRLAAIDANGRTGLIDEKITAEMRPAGPLTLGGLVLGVVRATGFAARLQFSTEAAAVAYVELCGTITDAMQVSAVFEVARTTDGPAMTTVNATAAATNQDGKLALTGTIPVGALAPGDYVIRAVVTVQGQGSGRVVRTLRKVG